MSLTEEVKVQVYKKRALITYRGYAYEKYKVKTADGYILRAHRIITDNPGGPPVMLQHGFMGASDSFVVEDPKNSLAFQLADSGFDVWLTDQRGDFYSREHVKYHPSEAKFWDFSFHEAGYYDLPAFIDTILQVTGYSQVYYIGHSMGTTVFLVMASTRPEYNNKIKAAVLLAPVALSLSMQEIISPLVRFIMQQGDRIYATCIKTGMYELLPRTATSIMAIRKFCNPSATQDICLDAIGTGYGENRENLDRNLLGRKLCYLPAGSSIKTGHHLTQIYRKGFRQYDYGIAGNLRHYQCEEPPHYNLQNVTAPVALYWGSNDMLLNRRSVHDLGQQLPNLIKIYEVPDQKFTHVDFIFGMNVGEVLNQDVVRLLQSLL